MTATQNGSLSISRFVVPWLNIAHALGVATAQAAQQRRKRLGNPGLMGSEEERYRILR